MILGGHLFSTLLVWLPNQSLLNRNQSFVKLQTTSKAHFSQSMIVGLEIPQIFTDFVCSLFCSQFFYWRGNVVKEAKFFVFNLTIPLSASNITLFTRNWPVSRCLTHDLIAFCWNCALIFYPVFWIKNAYLSPYFISKKLQKTNELLLQYTYIYKHNNYDNNATPYISVYKCIID